MYGAVQLRRAVGVCGGVFFVGRQHRFQYALNEECNIYLPHSFACSVGYVLSVLVFAVIVTWLSLQDMGDQATVQQLLTFYRFSAFFTMIVTCCIAFMSPNQFDPTARPDPPTFAPLPFVQWSGSGSSFVRRGGAGCALEHSGRVAADARQALCAAYGARCTAHCRPLLHRHCSRLRAGVRHTDAAARHTELDELHGSGWAGWFSSLHPHPLATLAKLSSSLFPICNQCSVYPLVVLTLGDNYYNLLPDQYHRTWDARVLKRGGVGWQRVCRPSSSHCSSASSTPSLPSLACSLSASSLLHRACCSWPVGGWCGRSTVEKGWSGRRTARGSVRSPLCGVC